MFTDIVDYSKMVQKDQSLTLELVEEHNQIIKGNIENFSGNIIKFTGDGFMAEFDSSTSAVTAAIAIQKDLSLRNETRSDKHQITIRIGMAPTPMLCVPALLFAPSPIIILVFFRLAIRL